MRLILILTLLSSCTNYKEDIKNQLILQKSYDYRLWQVKDVVITQEKDLSPSCKEISFNYTIQLKENCYPVKTVDNVLFNYFIDNKNYYEWDRCLSPQITNEKINNFKNIQSKLIDSEICSRTKHIVFGGDCIEWFTYKKEDLLKDIQQYRQDLNLSKQNKFILKNNVIQINDTHKICD